MEVGGGGKVCLLFLICTMPIDRVPPLQVVTLVRRAGMAGTVGTRGNYLPPSMHLQAYVGTVSSGTKTNASGKLCIT